MSDQQRTFVPGVRIKKHEFQSGGHVHNIGINVEELIAFLNLHKNERGWLNCTMRAVRDPKPGASTHYLELDIWDRQPSARPSDTQPPEQTPSPAATPPDDLPF